MRSRRCGRAQRPTASGGLGDLARLEAAGAYVGAKGAAVLLDPHLLQVRVEAALGGDHRVASGLAERGSLAAAVTYLGHRSRDGTGCRRREAWRDQWDPRVRLASAGPSGGRTQGGRMAAPFGRPRTTAREASGAARRARGSHWSLLAAHRSLEEGHAGDGEGGVAALVTLVAAGPGEGLLHVVAGDDTEGAGHSGCQLHVLDAAGRLGADEVVVVGLAADDDAEAGDAADLHTADVLRVFAADAVDDFLGGEGELVGAGHGVVGDVADRHAGHLEAVVGAVEQPQRQVLVEAPDDDREPQVREPCLLLVAELLEERPGLSHCRPWPPLHRVPPRRGASPRRGRGPGGAAS